MISFYSGTPGSGKSYHVVTDIYLHLCNKRKNTVITNIGLDFSGFKKVKGQCHHVPRFTVDYLEDFAFANHDFSGSVRAIEGQTLVVIDECQTHFNPRTYNQPDRLAWINFFTMHRHLGFDFILISQFDKLIDKQIRNNFEFEVVHRKINNFKIGKLLPVPVFICLTNWYGNNQRCGSEILIYRNKYGKAYASVRSIYFGRNTDLVVEEKGNSGDPLIDSQTDFPY